MFNKVVLVGNLTRDIEIRSTSSGMMVGATAIAVTRRFTDANGEKREETCFIDITFFARLAEIANLYLRKGSKVLIEGRLRQESWVDQNGAKRSKHSITVENMEMLGQANYEQGANATSAQQSYGGYQQNNFSSEAPSQDWYSKPSVSQANPARKQEVETIDLEDIDDSEDLPF